MDQSETPKTPHSQSGPDTQRFAELRRVAMQRQHVVRRSRIGRSGVLLVIAALALILLVTWRRDSLDRQDATNSLQAYINQAVTDGRHQLVLAYNSQEHNLILLSDGRSVVLLHGSHVKADWMTHKELTAQLSSQEKLLRQSEPSP